MSSKDKSMPGFKEHCEALSSKSEYIFEDIRKTYLNEILNDFDRRRVVDGIINKLVGILNE